MKGFSIVLIVAITVFASACGVEGAGEATDTDAQLGAATPDSGETQTPTNGQTGASTDNSGGEGGATTDGSQTNTQSPQSSTDNNGTAVEPNISFKGTTFHAQQESGNTITLDGSHSDIDNAQIISFQWTQPDNGQPIVELTNAESSVATFVASSAIDRVKLSFQLTVTASNGATANSTLDYQWIVSEVDPDKPSAITPTPTPTANNEPTDRGSYVFGKTGEYYAQSSASVYVADQTSNEIVQLNAATDSQIARYQLTARPTRLAFNQSAQSLYVALESTNKLAKLDTGTGLVSEHETSGAAKSLVAHKQRVYFTVEDEANRYQLLSIGPDDSFTTHGLIDGDLIAINPTTAEIVATPTGRSPATVYRYSLDANNMVVELQSSRELGSNASDFSISPDGTQLAMAAGSGNGTGYTIHDLSASDLTVSNGAWDTGAYPTSADFNDTGTLFAATNREHLFLFDAVSHQLKETHNLSEAKCGLNYYSLNEIRFSADGKHVFARLVCGFAEERTVLFFRPVTDPSSTVPSQTTNPDTTANPDSTPNPDATGNPDATSNPDTTANPDSTANPDTNPTPTLPATGSFALGETGSYFAKDLHNVYIAEQSLNQIVHMDMATSTKLGEYQLTDQPNLVTYLESINTLYVALKSAGKLVKINLDTHVQSDIVISSPAHAIVAHDDRMYYTTDSSSHNFDLYSVGSNDVPQLHGEIDTQLIDINPVTSDVIGVVRGHSPSTVYRYSLDASGTPVELESSRELGGNANDLSLSPDGLQLAVSAGSGNGDGYNIHDISASDLSVANGNWDTGAYPSSSDFSITGQLFAATDTTDIMIYGAKRHTLIKRHDIDENECGLNYYDVDDIKFSHDGQYVFARLICGFDKEKTVLFFFEAPDLPATASATLAPTPAAGSTVSASATFSLGKAGSYYAEHASSVYIADQIGNQIIQADLATGSVTNTFELDAQPTRVSYLESSHSLYVSFKVAGQLTKIDLITGTQTKIIIDSAALSISAHDDRLFFTTDNGSYSYQLSSVNNTDVPQSHGVIEGPLIKLNPVSNEIVAVGSFSPATTYRYALDITTNQAVELQSSRDLGGNVNDLAISPDGQQLAVVAGSGNGNGTGYTIHDIDASDLVVSNGAWDTGAYPTSGDFSSNGTMFASSDSTDLMIFDAISHTLMVSHDLDENVCGLSYYELDDINFTADGQHIIGKLVCGFDNQATVLMYSVP